MTIVSNSKILHREGGWRYILTLDTTDRDTDTASADAHWQPPPSPITIYLWSQSESVCLLTNLPPLEICDECIGRGHWEQEKVRCRTNAMDDTYTYTSAKNAAVSATIRMLYWTLTVGGQGASVVSFWLKAREHINALDILVTPGTCWLKYPVDTSARSWKLVRLDLWRNSVSKTKLVAAMEGIEHHVRTVTCKKNGSEKHETEVMGLT